MQKKIVSLILFVFLLGLVGYFMYSIMGLSGQSAMEAPIPMTALREEARVEEGSLLLNRGGAQVEVSTEATLEEGDTLSLVDGSTAVIYWPDGSMSTMEGTTTVILSTLYFDETTGETENALDIEVGDVWTKVMGMVTEGSQTTISARDTVAGIRGTELYHEVDGDTVIIGVLEHAVEVVTPEEETPTILALNQELEVTARGVAELGSVDLVERQDMLDAWDNRVATYTQTLGEKRRSLLVLPERSIPTIVNDHAKATAQDPWNGDHVMRNIQDMAAYIAEDMRISSEETLLQHAGVLRDMLTATRTAATSQEERELLLASLHFMAKALLTDVPHTPESIALRQMIQEQKAVLYADMGNTEAMELLLLRELFFVEDLSNAAVFDEVDMVIESIKNSTALRPIQEVDGRTAVAIRGVIEGMLRLKVASSEDLETIENTLFPSDELEEGDVTNVNTNAEEETDTQSTSQSLSTTTPTVTRVNANTNATVPARTTTNANANVRASTTVTPQTTQPSEPVVTPQTTTEETVPTIQVPNRTIQETVVPEPVETQTTTTTRSTISGGR